MPVTPRVKVVQCRSDVTARDGTRYSAECPQEPGAQRTGEHQARGQNKDRNEKHCADTDPDGGCFGQWVFDEQVDHANGQKGQHPQTVHVRGKERSCYDILDTGSLHLH
jgi:hypothetical protein